VLFCSDHRRFFATRGSAIIAAFLVILPGTGWRAAAQAPEPAPPLVASKSVLTQHNDNARTGAYLTETQLKPSTVNQSTFGRLYARHVNGQIAAQPLYVHGLETAAGAKNVVIVATQNNGLYAFDADDLDPNPDKAPLWQMTLVGSDGYGAREVPGMDRRLPNDTRGICGQTHGAMGITSGPVIDPLDGKLYVLAWMAPPNIDHGSTIVTTFTARHTIFVVDLKGLGPSTFARPLTDIAIPPPSNLFDPNAFDPNKELSRPALLLNKGMLYAAFGGLVCDDGAGDPNARTSARGWVVAYKPQDLLARPYSPKSPAPPASYFNASFDAQGQASMAGVWQSGQGLAADEDAVYFTTGNAAGAHAGQAAGESIVRLSPSSASSGGAHNFVVHSYKVDRADKMDRGDTDLGSGGVVLLPGNRLVAGGKEGRLYVVDRATMLPHKLPSPSDGASDGLRAYTNTWHPEIALDHYVDNQMYGPNIHGAPVVWTDSSHQTHLYAMPEKEFFTRHTLRADGSIDSELKRQSNIRSPDGMPGGVVSLSANGATDGIVWASVPKRDVLNEIGPGRLLAFDAETLALLWADDENVAFAKYTPPTVANGKVFRPTFGGELVVYGLLQGRPQQTVCNDALEAYRAYGGAPALGGPAPGPTAPPTNLALERYYFDKDAAGHATLKSYSSNSAIFYSPTTCGHVVRGDILQAYQGKGALLGLPITDDESTTGDRLAVMFGAMPEKEDMTQRYTHFERGSIFSSPRTHAHEIHGPIRDKWAALGWDAGLGFPKTDVVVSPDGRAQHSDFLKFNFVWPAAQDAESAIYYSQSTGAHSIFGGIYAYWQDHTDLGLPTDDEHDGRAPAPDNRLAGVQDFENGAIYWIKNVGPVEVFPVWKPNSSAKFFDATDEEIKLTKWDFTDVNAVNWALAARAATGFCAQRGFAGGLFTGEQLNGHRGIVCWMQGAGYFDSHDAELASQTWRLTSPQLDGNEWAVAGRTSDEYCRNRHFVSGFFTGNQGNDLKGVACVGAPEDAKDAQQADIDAVGSGFADVNTVPWALAARAGNRVCSDPRFHRNAIGGHFVGQQVQGARELVCVR
jgi:LGFP repeat